MGIKANKKYKKKVFKIAKKEKIEYHYYFLDSKRSRESLKQHFKKLGAKDFKESIQKYKSGKIRYRLGVDKKYA